MQPDCTEVEKAPGVVREKIWVERMPGSMPAPEVVMGRPVYGGHKRREVKVRADLLQTYPGPGSSGDSM